MRTVLILYGGKSGEHEVSLRSAASIVTHLQARYRLLLVGITKDGRFYLQPEEYSLQVATKGVEVLAIQEDPTNKVYLLPGEGFACNGSILPVDIVFPILHGTFGEDGTIQGLLETLDVAYVGAGVLGSAIGMDKEISKRLWEKDGLPIVPYVTLSLNQWKQEGNSVFQMAEQLGYPVFVKPACIGSSVGISKVKDSRDLSKAIERAFKFDTKVLIEKGIDAREIECSVLGNHTPVVFTPGEVIPSHEFYDYEAKYIDPKGAELRIPAQIPVEKQTKIKELALRAYRSIGVEGFARVDFFLERSTGSVYLNEINTIPGFTSISMFPRMCAFDGLSYGDLLDRLIQLGWERYQERKQLSYDYLQDTHQ
ncbi:MAG: D-alanine--D-alanine ligase [Spirochaetes bacterium]|nr:D-alanine--D-alanine ligase [Spirochaetota bacterium]